MLSYEIYISSLKNLRDKMQKANNKYASLLSEWAEANAIAYTKAEVKVLSDSINLKVSKDIYDTNNTLIANKFSQVNQTVDGITSTVQGLDGKYTELKQTVDGIDITGKVDYWDLENKNSWTTINGGNIKTDSISLNCLNSASTDPILKLFRQTESDGSTSYCSLDATYQYETGGRGNAIRLKWNKGTYVSVGAGTSTRFIDFYIDGSSRGAVRSDGLYSLGYKVRTSADWIPWNDISGKPSTFEPAWHDHYGQGMVLGHVNPEYHNYYNCGSLSKAWSYLCGYNLRCNNYGATITYSAKNTVDAKEFFKDYTNVSSNVGNLPVPMSFDENGEMSVNEVFVLNEYGESFVDNSKMIHMQSKCLETLVKENEILINKVSDLESRLLALENLSNK